MLNNNSWKNVNFAKKTFMDSNYAQIDKLPILGFEEELFAYISEGIFHLCDVNGNDRHDIIDEFLILGVYADCYSINIYKNTPKIIIVDKNGNVFKKTDCESPYYCYKWIDEDTIVCVEEYIHPNGYKKDNNVFHPMDYITFNMLSRCIKIRNNRAVILDEHYYLFSMLGMHFFADINEKFATYRNNIFEIDYSKSRFYILDENGKLVKEWTGNEILLELWIRKDGGFSAIGYKDDTEDYKINDRYITEGTTTYWSVTKEFEDDLLHDYKYYMSQGHWGKDDECYTNQKYFASYLEYKLYRCSLSENIKIKGDFYEFIMPDWKWDNKHERIKCKKNDHIFCDENFLICFLKYGFVSFDPEKFLVNKELIDKSVFKYENRSEHYKRLCNYNYINSLVGYSVEDVYSHIDNSDYEFHYEYVTGDIYYLLDAKGQQIGECKDGLFCPYTNQLGFPKVYGVLNSDTHTFIIPPIYSNIQTMDRYVEETDSKTAESSTSKYLYKDRRDNIITCDNTYYIVDVINGQKDSKKSMGIYCNENAEIPVGENEIKKIHDHYFLLKKNTDNAFGLYYYSGGIVCGNIKSVEVENLYYIEGWYDWRSDFNTNVYLRAIIVKAYMENGFFLVLDGIVVCDKLLKTIRPIVVNNEEVIFVACSCDGHTLLLSYKNNHLSEILNIDEELQVSILSAMNQNLDWNYNKQTLFLYKTGNKFTDLEIEHLKKQKCHLLFREEYRQQNLLYTKYKFKTSLVQDGENSFLQTEIDGKYAKGNFGLLVNCKNEKHNKELAPELSETIYLYGHKELGSLSVVLQFVSNIGSFGVYDTAKGWIVNLEHDHSIRQLTKCIIIDDRKVVSQLGELVYENNKMEFVASMKDVAVAFFIKDKNKYIIVEDGHIRENLISKEDDVFVWPDYDGMTSQYVLNVTERKLILNVFENSSISDVCECENHNSESYCPEWTLEDSWDAMTDGHDVEGAWDNDIFG